jgi:SPP1 gp7 family putative phage head morphogenesis protein
MKRKVTIDQLDPSRLNGLRRRFIAKLRTTYVRLARTIRNLLLEEKVLGSTKSPTIEVANGIINVMNVGSWSYETNPNKVKRFRAWLRDKMNSTLVGDSVIEQFINEAYSKGSGRAYTASKKRTKLARTKSQPSSISIIQDKDSQKIEERNFVKLRMSKKATVEKVKLLASRTFHELEGINQRMASNMSRALAEGLAYGRTVRQIAKQIVTETGIAFSRATTIVKTELLRAHSEGTLDTLQALGEASVSVAVEFQSEDDDRVCPKCQSLEGKIFGIDEARGKLPIHPNCRCAWIPLREQNYKSNRKIK